MLPTAHRMRRREEFALVVRRGRRAGSTRLVAHTLLPAPGLVRTDLMTTPDRPPTPPAAPGARVGFVVSKAVGTAVTRNQVKRRLRALVADRLDRLPAGSLMVVRANPAAARATSTALAHDLDRVLSRLLAAGRESAR